jgi:hypothetical protein
MREKVSEDNNQELDVDIDDGGEAKPDLGDYGGPEGFKIPIKTKISCLSGPKNHMWS